MPKKLDISKLLLVILLSVWVNGQAQTARQLIASVPEGAYWKWDMTFEAQFFSDMTFGLRSFPLL